MEQNYKDSVCACIYGDRYYFSTNFNSFNLLANMDATEYTVKGKDIFRRGKKGAQRKVTAAEKAEKRLTRTYNTDLRHFKQGRLHKEH